MSAPGDFARRIAGENGPEAAEFHRLMKEQCPLLTAAPSDRRPRGADRIEKLLV